MSRFFPGIIGLAQILTDDHRFASLSQGRFLSRFGSKCRFWLEMRPKAAVGRQADTRPSGRVGQPQPCLYCVSLVFIASALSLLRQPCLDCVASNRLKSAHFLRPACKIGSKCGRRPPSAVRPTLGRQAELGSHSLVFVALALSLLRVTPLWGYHPAALCGCLNW